MHGSCDVSGKVIENRNRYGGLSWKPCITCTCIGAWKFPLHITQGCVLPPCPVQVTVPVGKCCPTCPLDPGIQVTDSQGGVTPTEADNITADIRFRHRH